MDKLTRDDLYSLEKYAEVRKDFRADVMRHKQNRMLPIGLHATLYFEDRKTIHYQIQEMLRAERIFEPAGIEDEMSAYNPLIPDGSNWKATFMLEYTDIEERNVALKKLVGIEDKVWMRVNGHDPVYPIADEDLDRDTEDQTSAVHFLRFELDAAMRADVRKGAAISAGIEHPQYRYEVDPIPDNIRTSLAADLD